MELFPTGAGILEGDPGNRQDTSGVSGGVRAVKGIMQSKDVDWLVEGDK